MLNKKICKRCVEECEEFTGVCWDNAKACWGINGGNLIWCPKEYDYISNKILEEDCNYYFEQLVTGQFNSEGEEK